MVIFAVSVAESVSLPFLLNHISSSGEPIKYAPSEFFWGSVYVFPSHATCTSSVSAGIETAAPFIEKLPFTALYPEQATVYAYSPSGRE